MQPTHGSVAFQQAPLPFRNIWMFISLLLKRTPCIIFLIMLLNFCRKAGSTHVSASEKRVLVTNAVAEAWQATVLLQRLLASLGIHGVRVKLSASTLCLTISLMHQNFMKMCVL